MEDRAVVAAIVAGDPDGLAAAYDQYAAPLYTYCRTMLRESADASDAVQDTFVIAAAKLSGLRDPDRLRPWLYAVARNECHRRLRGKEFAGLDEAPDVTDDSGEIGRGIERAELSELVHAAMTGLNAGEREVLDLNLRHQLEGADLADALGVSRNHAHALLSRARNQMKTSLGTLLVARGGRQACSTLDAMLATWDGHLTVLLRKQINRHIDNCDTCGERRRRDLTPAMLLGVLPLAALPPGLRERVLKLCADSSPRAAAYRARATRRAGSFGSAGFPKAISPPWGGRWREVRKNAMTTAVAAAVVLLATAGILAWLAANGTPPAQEATGVGAGAVISSSPDATSAASPVPTASGGTPTASGAASASASSAPSVAATLGPAPAPSAGPGSPSPRASSTATRSPSPSPRSPSPAPSKSAQPTPTPTPTPTLTPGTLAVTPRVAMLAGTGNGLATGTITLTAEGGPVRGFSVSVPAGLTVAPSSGALASGQSVTITVSASTRASINTQITISPGDVTITVEFTIPDPE